MTSSTTKPVPTWCEDILTDRPTGHICTIRPDGRLSVNPVCVMWDGEYVRVSTLKSRKKYRNLRHDPRVAISIPHRNNPNRYLEITGVAELTDDPDRSFVNSIARTFMGVDEYPFDRPGDERAVITIHAQKVYAPRIPLADTPPTAPETEHNKQLARNFIDAINRQDIAAITDAYAADGTCWTPGNMPISGTFTRDQIAENSKLILQAFPQGLTITIKSMTAEEDRVAIEAESQGRHASGKPYHNQYHFLMRLREGKIIEWREYMDTMHANEVICGGGSR